MVKQARSKDKPGFGSIGEAIGGIRYLTGYPDRLPTRVGISLGDSLAALYAVIGAMMAVYHRDVKGTGQGQYVDVALYEAVFSLMESMVPEFDQFGFILERTGSTLPGIAPSNTYECKDGKHIVIGANGDAIFKRLMNLIGREDLAKDEKYSSNEKRANHAEFLDEQIEKWTKQHPFQTVMSLLDKAGVPAGPIYNVKDIFMDKHYKEREMIQDVFVKGIGKLKVPGLFPN